MTHSDPKIVAKMLKPLGRRVLFQYPGNEEHKRGVLKDRAIIPSNPGTTGVPYWDVLDLISFPEESEPDWIRIGYYRKPKTDSYGEVKPPLQSKSQYGNASFFRQPGRRLGSDNYCKMLSKNYRNELRKGS